MIPQAVTTLLQESEARIFSWIPLWKIPFWPSTLRFQSSKRTILQVLEDIIEKREAQKDLGENCADLLGRLLASEDKETGQKIGSAQLRDELMTFLIAGHETTAAMIAFFLYIISVDETVAKQVSFVSVNKSIYSSFDTFLIYLKIFLISFS